jgi:hypothetical protein
MCQGIVVVSGPGFAIILDVFADLLPETLQNLLVVMLVNHLAWRNKFLMNNALQLEMITNMLLLFTLTYLAFFGCAEDGLFR